MDIIIDPLTSLLLMPVEMFRFWGGGFNTESVAGLNNLPIELQ